MALGIARMDLEAAEAALRLLASRLSCRAALFAEGGDLPEYLIPVASAAWTSTHAIAAAGLPQANNPETIDPTSVGIAADWAALHWVRTEDPIAVAIAGDGANPDPVDLSRHLIDAGVIIAGLAGEPIANGAFTDLRAWLDTQRGQLEGRSHSLLLFEFDGYGALEEFLGTSNADTLLRLVSARLMERVGRTASRTTRQGNRIVALVPNEKGKVDHLARDILRLVADPIAMDGRTVTASGRIGIVASVDTKTDSGEALRHAEAALRRASANAPRSYVVHDRKHDALERARESLDFDLSQALGRQQLHLAYQPIVELASGNIIGAEALMRWRHPVRGELQPSTFVPAAERTGTIVHLDTWALQVALREAKSWPEDTLLAVNVSAVQFRQPDFVANVFAELAATGFPAGRLELEVTETVLMREGRETEDTLRALIAAGVRIALDDFGTGYSALAYLARLPHHRIKLDRVFVRDLANPATAGLIEAVVAAARDRDVMVTAEGVETTHHMEAVRRIGFTHAQGFATGAPSCNPAMVLSGTLPQAAV